MSNKEPGYVYILTHSTSGRLLTCKRSIFGRFDTLKNPSFRDDWVKTIILHIK